jgi:predicted membrane metal-binding protein
MHMAMVFGTIVWFVLVGLLWYARPGKVAWLAGSLLLGAVWFTAFAWYVTRRR